MPMYVLYKPDGSIHQSNMVYDDAEKFESFLNEANMTARIKFDGSPGLAPPEKWYVDIPAQEVVMRPIMPIEVSKTIIQCGEQDSAIFRGIPRNSKITIRWMDSVVYPESAYEAEELELSIPVPATYVVIIDCWPYRTFTQTIQAVA